MLEGERLVGGRGGGNRLDEAAGLERGDEREGVGRRSSLAVAARSPAPIGFAEDVHCLFSHEETAPECVVPNARMASVTPLSAVE